MRVHFDGLRRPARVAKNLRTELSALGNPVGLGKAQDLVAVGFGYASYRELQAVTEQSGTTADPWDEDVAPEVSAARRARQASAFKVGALTEADAIGIVARIGPSARNPANASRKGRPAADAPALPAEEPSTIPVTHFATSTNHEEILERLTVATGYQPRHPVVDGAYLDNGWLLHSGSEDMARIAAGVLSGGGKPVERIILVEAWVVLAFSTRHSDTLPKEATDLFGDPASRGLLRSILREAHSFGANRISTQKTGSTWKVVATASGNRLPILELDNVAYGPLASECWRLSRSSQVRNYSRQATGRLGRRGHILPSGVDHARIGFVPIGNWDVQIEISLFDQDAASAAGRRRHNLVDADLNVTARMTRRSAGLNLVAGPAQSGKTATTAAILGAVSGGNRRIAWITDGSDPVVPDVSEMLVTQSGEDADEYSQAWVNAIEAAQRSGSEIIMAGEISDRRIAMAAVSAAMSGHQVWATIRANGAIESLRRLRDLGIESDIVHDAGIVTGLVGQRLVRATCQDCALDYGTACERGIVDADLQSGMARIATMEGDRRRFRFAHPKGCPSCIGGFNGQVAVTEAFPTNPQFMERLEGNERSAALKCIQRPTMLERAVDMAREGILDLNEVETRVGFLEDLPARYGTQAEAA